MTLYTFLHSMIVTVLGWFADRINWLVDKINWGPLTKAVGWVGRMIMGDTSLNFLTVLLAVVIVLVITFINLIVIMWFELKLFARFYHGRGPTEVGYAGLLQNLAHGMKLFLKELIMPKKADKWAYLIAPCVYIGTAFAVLVAIPWTEGFFLGRHDLGAGFLLVFALFSLAPFMIFVAGWASNNKYSLLGGMRSASQMISYEVPLLLSVTGVVLLAQSLSLTDITHAQNTHWLKGLLPGWFIFLQPLGAVIFFIAVIAELERIPFDLPEAEAELVEGWKTEYGGIRFGLLMFTEWARGFAASALFVLLFLGGWQGPFIHVKYAGFNFGALIGIVWFFTKAYLVFAVMVWVRASLPRIRIDQLLKICWSVLLPLAVLNMFLAVAAFTVWQEMGLAYAIGFSMVSFIVVALFFLLKKPSESGSGEEKQEMETAMTDEDEPGVTDG